MLPRLVRPTLPRLLPRSPTRSMRIVPVPVRQDNYAYILMSTPTQAGKRPQAVFVDVYDVPKVRDAAHKLGLQDNDVVGLLTTHHHYDHAGGNKAFVKAFPHVPVWGGSDECDAVSHIVRDGESFDLFTESAPVRVHALATPCHTMDSICYFVEDAREDAVLAQTPLGFKEGADGDKARGVFTGDTLFIAGSGRFFEGTPENMDHALNKVLASLPDDTLVYCGHEYTRSNAEFALGVLPDQPAVQALVRDLRKKRNNGVTTGIYTIADERAHNPFMLVRDPAVQRVVQSTDAVHVMQFLREAKNAGSICQKI